MIIVTLMLAGSLAWFFSTLAGRGSPLILLPVLGWFLDAAVIPPVLTTGMLLGNVQRMGMYWRAIDWPSTVWYLPGAIMGFYPRRFCLCPFTIQMVAASFGNFSGFLLA